MHIQIEVTTKCNYECFYCAGRDLPQKHLDMALFERIMKELPKGAHRISLQGEGEPMMHPHFWEMVETVVAQGHMPYTITNGSLMKAAKVAQHFPRIGISLDTVDPAEAQRIKRYKLDKMLEKLDELLIIYEPHRIVIHTVDYGQDMTALKAFLQSKNITKHIVQPLQTKADYSYLYKDRITFVTKDEDVTYSCEFLNKPIMQYYNITGTRMPCCYIKDASQFTSSEVLLEQLNSKIVPSACKGCSELKQGASKSRVFLI